MSALVEAQTLLRKVAEPVPAGDSVKAAIVRASRRLKWNFNRTKSLWYADARAKVSADEINQLRDVAGRSKAGATEDDLLERLEWVETQLRALQSLRSQDADFYGAQADIFGDAACKVGRLNPSDR